MRTGLILSAASALALVAASALPAAAEGAAPFRVCTAAKTGNYFAFAATLGKTLGQTLPVEPIVTDGSWANLTKLKNGECDAAVVQSDADFVFRSTNAGAGLAVQRVGAVFRESLNLVCNAGLGISDLGDLVEQRPKVAVGKVGSGSWVSWNGLVFADRTEGGDEYSAIPVEPVGGTLALTQIVDGTEVGCLFFTMSGNSEFVAQIAAVAGKGSVLDFVDIADKDFNDTLDARGKPIYEPAEVGYEGFGHWSDTSTYEVSAVFYVADRWMSAHPDEFETVVSVFLPVVANVKAARNLD